MEDIRTIIDFLEVSTKNRLENFFEGKSIEDFNSKTLILDNQSTLYKLSRLYNLTKENLLLLTTTLVPHIIPGFFDKIIQKFLPHGGDFPEFGGVKLDQHRGMVPTGETILFILAGLDIQERLKYLPLLDKSNLLFKHRILYLEPVKIGEPRLGGKLVMDPEYVEVLTTGKISLPSLSINFPAEHLQSEMTWEDLVLPDQVWHQVKELQIWLKHKETLNAEWDLGRKLKPGYRALFYGPPGTGKTITATLLAKYTGKEVFRIDLSMIVSKYIGETEKNLSALFDKAENKDWILFFDEADAIFGKRTGVRDAHDKYANQEVSYLLQRIESYNGLVILASNFRNNIDTAFIRRFNSIVYFPAPKAEDRLALWKKSIPENLQMGQDLILKDIADGFELTGSHILNIIQYISLVSLDTKNSILTKELMVKGIRRELEKEGK
ncbi:ATP-binding protein [Aquiflexum gelatinilyticum]|uniref:ATP-binding protein n=1 Tax=Aquiflexum gelatinilyticum TaxID=2961943 RepID=A0A9X2P4F4_9BACT|nr:ATP-binding protein [Aquiflexum gelatinilyticum]MCR9014581.1 ATP-binding protein [Aquiflexum gelatinilyticum]